MNNKIILLSGYDRFFGQTRKPWVSINTGLLFDELNRQGFEVSEYPFSKMINTDLKISDSIIFYTFSQRDNLRHYIKDIVTALKDAGNLIVPNYDLLLCHENKGYQEIIKKQKGIVNLHAMYFSSKRELVDYRPEYPLVLKTLEGSNGKGVFLVHNEAQLFRQIKQLEPKLSWLTKLDLLRRKYFRTPKQFPGYESFSSRKDLEQYKDYITPEIGFVLQQFIPVLQFDYRVIILGEHYYVTKRLVRKNDFRASGAKRFTFDFTASDELLDYARDIFKRFDSPCLSIDIGEANREFFLFEFQALHFGINAIVRGNGYYEHTAKGWSYIQEKTIFEKELADSLQYYLKHKVQD